MSRALRFSGCKKGSSCWNTKTWSDHHSSTLPASVWYFRQMSGGLGNAGDGATDGVKWDYKEGLTETRPLPLEVSLSCPQQEGKVMTPQCVAVKADGSRCRGRSMKGSDRCGPHLGIRGFKGKRRSRAGRQRPIVRSVPSVLLTPEETSEHLAQRAHAEIESHDSAMDSMDPARPQKRMWRSEWERGALKRLGEMNREDW